MLKRNEARKRAMTILYQIEISKENNFEYDIASLMENNDLVTDEFGKELVHGVLLNNQELEMLANKYLTDWNIKRLDKIGSVLLKIALYELKYTDTPYVVVINEAVELAKNYCDEELAKMINAVLDHYIKE